MLTLAVLPVLVVAAGCGGGGGGDSKSAQRPPDHKAATAGPPVDARQANRAAVKTIRDWANAVRNSHIEAAAALFSLPTIAVNGPDPNLLRTRQEVTLWNEALPCGAALLRAVDVRGWTVARFRLVHRRGSQCDANGASTASTAFAMRHGKIALWVRVRDDVAPEKAAPARRPDARFLRTGRIPGVPAAPPAGGNGGFGTSV